MDKILQLNTAMLSLSFCEVENRLVSSVSDVADNQRDRNVKFNVKFDKVNINLEGNSVKLDSFQKVVVMFNKTVAGLEVELSKHKANILEYKDKISQT